MSLSVRSVAVGPFQENSYLIVDDSSRRAVLVDPGDEPARLVKMVRDAGVVPEAIWLTHAHIDHIGAVAAMLREWEMPVYLHEADAPLWRAAPQQGAFYGVPFEPAPEPGERIT